MLKCCKYCVLFVCFFWDGVSFCHQAGVQWCNLTSLQPPPPRFKQFFYLNLVAWIIGMHHHAQLIFCILSRDRISTCWSGRSWTSDLRWSVRFGQQKCWDYRCELLHLASDLVKSLITPPCLSDVLPHLPYDVLASPLPCAMIVNFLKPSPEADAGPMLFVQPAEPWARITHFSL